MWHIIWTISETTLLVKHLKTLEGEQGFDRVSVSWGKQLHHKRLIV